MSDTILTTSGNSESGENTTANGEQKNIRPYDFKHPKLISKEIMRALRNIHELLSQNMARIFTDSLNQKVDITLQEIDEVIFSEFMGELNPPSALFLFKIQELKDWAILDLDPSFCLYCMERQGGSPGNYTKSPRALTRIEERVILRIINKIFAELSHVWSPYLDFTIQDHIYESKPANIRTISGHVPGIVIRYTISVDDLEVPLNICYPYELLKEQIKISFHGSEKTSGKVTLNATDKETFENYMKGVSISLRVILGEAKFSMQELVKIEEGDVIKLGKSIDEPLDILVNGTPKMVGYPGNMRGKKAVKIFDITQSLNQHEEL